MIRADQLLRAPRRPFDQPHRAMAADIGEAAHRAVIAAHGDHAFPEIVERMEIACLGEVADVTDDLP
jgi:hypothetical protein